MDAQIRSTPIIRSSSICALAGTRAAGSTSSKHRVRITSCGRSRVCVGKKSCGSCWPAAGWQPLYRDSVSYLLVRAGVELPSMVHGPPADSAYRAMGIGWVNMSRGNLAQAEQNFLAAAAQIPYLKTSLSLVGAYAGPSRQGGCSARAGGNLRPAVSWCRRPRAYAGADRAAATAMIAFASGRRSTSRPSQLTFVVRFCSCSRARYRQPT